MSQLRSQIRVLLQLETLPRRALCKCAHVSQCGVTHRRLLYDWRLEESRLQAWSKQAATCRCSSPPSTASHLLLWSPVARPDVPGAITSSEPVAACAGLKNAECSQLIRCNARTLVGMLQTTAVDWSDSCEETVCDRTGRLGRAC